MQPPLPSPHPQYAAASLPHRGLPSSSAPRNPTSVHNNHPPTPGVAHFPHSAAEPTCIDSQAEATNRSWSSKQPDFKFRLPHRPTNLAAPAIQIQNSTSENKNQKDTQSMLSPNVNHIASDWPRPCCRTQSSLITALSHSSDFGFFTDQQCGVG